MFRVRRICGLRLLLRSESPVYTAWCKSFFCLYLFLILILILRLLRNTFRDNRVIGHPDNKVCLLEFVITIDPDVIMFGEVVRCILHRVCVAVFALLMVLSTRIRDSTRVHCRQLVSIVCLFLFICQYGPCVCCNSASVLNAGSHIVI